MRDCSTEPRISMLAYKGIVIEMRIGLVDAVDLFPLSGRQIFVGVETPCALEQALSPQNFMNSRNTPSELMGGVEKRGIGISDLLCQGEQLRVDPTGNAPCRRKMTHSSLCPYRPVPQEATDNP